MTGANEELVAQGDLDELVRHVDRLCRARAWDDLEDLRHRCRRALDRGRQLWPVSSLAEYRLALEASGPHAAAVVVEGTGHLALGPLAEVAAQDHTWAELGPHVPPGPARAVCAHERVVRGEDVAALAAADPGLAPGDPDPLGLPLALARWEPAWPVATYHDDRVETPRPPLPPTRPVALPAAGEADPTDPGAEALRNLVRAWTTGSDGRVEAVAVTGAAPTALAALGLADVRATEVPGTEALAHMAWAAAAGGAHGRRRGAAVGRFEAWWALAALAGLDGDWPPAADDLAVAVDELRWFLWEAEAPDSGWHLRLAVEDPLDGLAWAVSALDTA